MFIQGYTETYLVCKNLDLFWSFNEIRHNSCQQVLTPKSATSLFLLSNLVAFFGCLADLLSLLLNTHSHVNKFGSAWLQRIDFGKRPARMALNAWTIHIYYTEIISAKQSYTNYLARSILLVTDMNLERHILKLNKKWFYFKLSS